MALVVLVNARLEKLDRLRDFRHWRDRIDEDSGERLPCVGYYRRALARMAFVCLVHARSHGMDRVEASKVYDIGISEEPRMQKLQQALSRYVEED